MDSRQQGLSNELATTILIEAVKKFLKYVASCSVHIPSFIEGMGMDDMDPLRAVMDLIHAEHLGLGTGSIAPGKAITYLHVHEEDDFSIGIFVLPPHARIPLHDHPRMCVISRLLRGSLIKTSYDWDDEEVQMPSSQMAAQQENKRLQGQARVRQARQVGGPIPVHGPVTFALTGHQENLHEFEAGAAGAAILDVLMPPYAPDNDRDVTYYRVRRLGDKRHSFMGGRKEGHLESNPGGKIQRGLRHAVSARDVRHQSRVWLEPALPDPHFEVLPGEYCGPSYNKAFLAEPQNRAYVDGLIHTLMPLGIIGQSMINPLSEQDSTASIMLGLHNMHMMTPRVSGHKDTRVTVDNSSGSEPTSSAFFFSGSFIFHDPMDGSSSGLANSAEALPRECEGPISLSSPLAFPESKRHQGRLRTNTPPKDRPLIKLKGRQESRPNTLGQPHDRLLVSSKSRRESMPNVKGQPLMRAKTLTPPPLSDRAAASAFTWDTPPSLKISSQQEQDGTSNISTSLARHNSFKRKQVMDHHTWQGQAYWGQSVVTSPNKTSKSPKVSPKSGVHKPPLRALSPDARSLCSELEMLNSGFQLQRPPLPRSKIRPQPGVSAGVAAGAPEVNKTRSLSPPRQRRAGWLPPRSPPRSREASLPETGARQRRAGGLPPRSPPRSREASLPETGVGARPVVVLALPHSPRGVSSPGEGSGRPALSSSPFRSRDSSLAEEDVLGITTVVSSPDDHASVAGKVGQEQSASGPRDLQDSFLSARSRESSSSLLYNTEAGSIL